MICIPLLDSRMEDLEEKLSPEMLSLFQLDVFLKNCVLRSWLGSFIREAVKIYNELLHSPNVSIVLSEFQFWITEWKREIESSNKLPESLQIIEQYD